MTDANDQIDGSRISGHFEVLIAGAGVAGLEAAFALRELAGERVRLTLVAPASDFVYRPMAVGEPFTRGRARHYPVAKLAGEADAAFVHDAVVKVDAEHRLVHTASGSELSYDALFVGLGASLDQSYKHSTPFDDARIDDLLHGLVQDIEEGYVKHLAIVVPAPTPWPLPAYELALMCSERAWDMQTELKVTVVTPEPSPLAVFGRKASVALSRLLGERNIEVINSTYCDIPRSKTITLRPNDRTLEVDRVVALPRLRGPTLAGLPHDRNGFIPVDEQGRVRGANRVWAAGDATDCAIKFGGVAAQLADTAAQSIGAVAGECPEPRPFEPELEGLLLTGGTPRFVRGRPTGGHGDDSELAKLPGGAYPPKIAARYLTPHLVEHDPPATTAPA